jgi:hypothetical protein
MKKAAIGRLLFVWVGRLQTRDQGMSAAPFVVSFTVLKNFGGCQEWVCCSKP